MTLDKLGLDTIAADLAGRLFGRLIRRAVAWLAVALFMGVAILQFTLAGLTLLETQYGMLRAQLIVGAVYALIALITLAVLWGTRNAPRHDNASAPPREFQLAMLAEAVMLGFMAARKRPTAP